MLILWVICILFNLGVMIEEHKADPNISGFIHLILIISGPIFCVACLGILVSCTIRRLM